MEFVVDESQSSSVLNDDSSPESWYLIAQGKAELQLYQCIPNDKHDQEPELNLVWTEPGIAQSFVSNSGQFICYQKTGQNSLHVIKSDTREVIGRYEFSKDTPPKAVEFSPLDTHIVILTGWSEEYCNNLNVYKLQGDVTRPVLSFEYRKFHTIKRLPIWTLCESFCIIRIGDDINVYKQNDFPRDTAPFGVIKISLDSPQGPRPLPSSVALAISPTKKGDCYVTIFVPNQGKNDQGILRLYNVFEPDKPVFNHLFTEAEEGEFFWNRTASALCFRTFTNNVKGLASYYGGNGLYLVHPSKGSYITLFTAQGGLVHDVVWLRSNELLTSRGSMPAELDMYNGATGKKVLSFGRGGRNTILKDPFDRLVIMAGFGNLSGDLDVWDLKAKTKIAQAKAPCSVTCDFSPDGRYFVTATTVPRMRVDCGFKIYSYSGKMVKRIDFEVLHYIHIYVPPNVTFKPRDPSPSVCLRPQDIDTSRPQRYKPPGSSSTVSNLYRSARETQVVVAVAQAPTPSNKPLATKGPPGADALLLSAAAKISKKKNKK